MYAIIPLVLLILFIITFIIVGLFTKAFIDKKTLLYTIPLLLITWHLYAVGYNYSKGFFDMTSAMECLVCALKAFAFDTKREFYQALGETNVLYLVDIYMATILSGLTLVSSVLGFFKVGLVNFFKMIYRLRKRNPDLVYGYNDDAFKYCKNNRKAILWIDADEKKLTGEDKKKLFLSNIIFIHNDFQAKLIKRYTKFASGTVHIICFQSNNENMAKIYQTIKELDITKPIQFHVQCDSNYLSIVNQQLNEKVVSKKVNATVFDYYELMGRRFSKEHNLAKYLPRSFIKDGQILPDKEISVVMLGFGKTSSAIFKSLVINNQFVTTKNRKLVCKPIHYYIYDKENNALKKNIIGLFDFYNKIKYDKDYFPKYELPADIHIENKNINSEVPELVLSKLKSNSNEYVFYVVAMPNNIDTIALVKKLAINTDPKQTTIFYNIDNASEEITEHANCYPIGYKNQILKHDFITDDGIYHLANLTNEQYFALHNDDNHSGGFSELTIDEKLSNIYADLNYQFKLNLLGLDYTDKNVRGLTHREYMKIYDPKWDGKEYRLKNNKTSYYKYDNYEEYYKVNTRMTLAYQEHLRWVMLYIILGYKPMKKKDIKIYRDNDGTYIDKHKDNQLKLHACLTSQDGLHEYHKFLLNLYHRNGEKNKVISEIETIQYDLMHLDNNVYEFLGRGNYKIIRL